MLTATPLIYCPVDIKRPSCVPPGRAPIALLAGKGPDAVTEIVDGQERTTGGGGTIYGSGYDPATRATWKKTRAGWWVQLLNHRPQDLIRIQRHPRVRQWATIQGVRPDHQWQVPVLFDLTGGSLTSALDGVWDGERWTGGELEPLQQEMLALIRGIDQGVPVELAKEARRLAMTGLALGQFVDEDLLAVAGWYGETLGLQVLAAMAGEAPRA